ncbi:unnamed protein product, partial [Urochloa humidicola]
NQCQNLILQERAKVQRGALKEHMVPSSSILDLKAWQGKASLRIKQVNSEKPAAAQFIHKSQLLNK